MLEAQLIRTDSDMFTTTETADPIRVDQLREHFSPKEARMFGIDQPYDRDAQPETVFVRLSRRLAATMVSTYLFAGVGLLGISSGAFA